MLKYKLTLLLALIAAPTIFVTGQQQPTPTPIPLPSPEPPIKVCKPPIPECPATKRFDPVTCRCVDF